MANTKTKPTNDTVVTVNGKLFLAIVLSVGAWHLYPDNIKGWGWGLIAILMWVSAFGCFIHAIKAMRKQKKRDDAFIEKTKDRAEMSGTDMADDDVLRRGGAMYED